MRIPVAIFIFILTGCNHAVHKYPHVKIETQFGDIEVELYPDRAPKTVAAFLSYIDSGFYKNGSFYRSLNAEDQPSASFKSDLIQGGIWQTNYKKGISLPGIPHEPTNQTGILHKNGTISMARTTIGTASSEFFICIGDQPMYDYGGDANADRQGFAAFGKVVKGMKAVKDIHQQPNNEELLYPPIPIFNIKKL